MQELTWTITLGLVLALALVFVVVAARSGNGANYSLIQRGANRFRVYYFWALIAVISVATIVTLSRLPYPAKQAAGDAPQVINATAFQWYWELTGEKVSANRPVEFRVSAKDVNHGFGLYDSSLRLLAQTQAMPGYVNVLRYTFDKAGTYQILCLEYCGLAHHSMTAKITVTNP